MSRPRIAHLPFRHVLRISWRNIRHRFWRCTLATGGIVLSVAFLVHMLSLAAIASARGGHGLSRQEQWLSCISLLACAVGIVNAMLMNVMERYREIGTIKCLGALDRLIVQFFLIEAVLMGLCGSLLGTFLGWGLALLSSLSLDTAVEVESFPWSLLLQRGALASLIGLAITILAAVYPSWRAARMAPAEAMRTEV